MSRQPALTTTLSSIMKGLIATAAAFTVTAAGAMADTEQCPFNYATFEATVPHIDVHECPDLGLGENIFCRASAAFDQIHVFAFSQDGAQCLLKVQSYDEASFALSIGGEKKSD